MRELGKTPEEALINLRKLHAEGSKERSFKMVQGRIWKKGYESNELTSHLFPDVVPAIQRSLQLGMRVYIYSSGSVPAQKLYFEHSDAGNLLKYFSGYYDTTIGLKTECGSYVKIVGNSNPREWLFLSDNINELKAARKVGLHTGLVVRPGNDPVVDTSGFPVYNSFEILFTE